MPVYEYCFSIIITYILKQYDYKRKLDNIYHKSLYSSYDPQKKRQYNQDEHFSRGSKNRYNDPYRNSSFAPGIPLINKWKYIRTDFYLFQNGEPSSPFKLYLDEVLREMGTLNDIQVIYRICKQAHLTRENDIFIIYIYSFYLLVKYYFFYLKRCGVKLL